MILLIFPYTPLDAQIPFLLRNGFRRASVRCIGSIVVHCLPVILNVLVVPLPFDRPTFGSIFRALHRAIHPSGPS